MTYEEKEELLTTVWIQLPLDDKERLLVEDGWQVLIDDLAANK